MTDLHQDDSYPWSGKIPSPSHSLLLLVYKGQPWPCPPGLLPPPHLISYPPTTEPFFQSLLLNSLFHLGLCTCCPLVSSQVLFQSGSSLCFRSQLNCTLLSRIAFPDHPSYNTPCPGLSPLEDTVSFFSGLITNGEATDTAQ